MRLAAESAGKALMQNISEYAIMEVLPTLLLGMDLKKLWQTKVRQGHELNLISAYSGIHGRPRQLCIHDCTQTVGQLCSEWTRAAHVVAWQMQ